ncbi:MAG: helix-turn-helix domain-containing protein [Deltaproteobacteria bacterium]
MKKRRPNPRLVKIHRNYSIEEIAKLFDIHKNTVRHWLKNGLITIDDKRPLVILGRVLADFLQTRRAKNKRTCNPGELYCVRCRSPKPPAEGMAEYSPVTEKLGRLIAICPDCESIMNRNVSMARIQEFRSKMDITFPEAVQRIVERSEPSVNSDLE